MQKALNMKLLILILTALAALSAVVVNHEIHVAQETRRANIAEKLRTTGSRFAKMTRSTENKNRFRSNSRP